MLNLSHFPGQEAHSGRSVASGGRGRQAFASKWSTFTFQCQTDRLSRPYEQDEKGERLQDWFEPDMDKIEARNLLRFGMEGVVDYNY